MPLSFTERFVLLGVLGQAFGVVGTLARVELARPSEQAHLRSTDYATLAGSLLASSLLGATALYLGRNDPQG